MNAQDLFKPGALVIGMAAAAALGFAAGYLVARDPTLLRRLFGSAAGGLERLVGAAAETREELADLWAGSRAGARETMEDESFAAAAASAAVAAAAGKAAAPAAAATAPVAAAKRGRRTVAKSRPAARRPRASAAPGR